MKVNIISYILAAIFILSGAAKLAGLEFEILAFERWGYAIWFMYFIGACELAGGLALALNRFRLFAAPALSILMTGAIVTHVHHSEWPMFAIASTIFGMAVLLSFYLWNSKASKLS
jgi:putative oxidoreductase